MLVTQRNKKMQQQKLSKTEQIELLSRMLEDAVIIIRDLIRDQPEDCIRELEFLEDAKEVLGD